MNFRSRFFKIVLHFIFWIIAGFVFIQYSYLRPGHSGTDAYKGIFCVVMIAAIIYLNRFILFQKLFLKGNNLGFWGVNVALIIMSGFIEFQLVKSNISLLLETNLTVENYFWGLLSVFALVSLRDAAFFAFFFFINVNRHMKQLLQDKEKLLAIENNQIIIKPPAQENIMVCIRDITHISIDRNCLLVHLINNESYKQYQTLTYMEEIIPKHLGLRINRSIIIMYKYVSHYDEFGVTLRINDNYDRVHFLVSQTQRTEIFNILKQNVRSNVMKINCEVKKDKRDEKLRSKKDDNCELNGVSKQIFEIIRVKPNIFASEIKNKLSNISSRTIDNYLRQLKDLDLIEYKGSYKTGGYFIKATQ